MQGDRSRRRIGMLTPSSNTVLEPMATEILRGVPRVSVHFSRLQVTQISLEDAALPAVRYRRPPRRGKTSRRRQGRRHRLERHVGVMDRLRGRRETLCGNRAHPRRCRDHRGPRHQRAARNPGNPALRSRFALHRHRSAEDHRDLRGRRVTNASPSAASKSRSTTHLPKSRICGSRKAVRQVSTAGPEAVVIMCTNLRSAHLGRCTGGGAGSARSRFGRRLRLEGGPAVRNRHRGYHRLGAFVQSAG